MFPLQRTERTSFNEQATPAKILCVSCFRSDTPAKSSTVRYSIGFVFLHDVTLKYLASGPKTDKTVKEFTDAMIQQDRGEQLAAFGNIRNYSMFVPVGSTEGGLVPGSIYNMKQCGLRMSIYGATNKLSRNFELKVPQELHESIEDYHATIPFEQRRFPDEYITNNNDDVGFVDVPNEGGATTANSEFEFDAVRTKSNPVMLIELKGPDSVNAFDPNRTDLINSEKWFIDQPCGTIWAVMTKPSGIVTHVKSSLPSAGGDSAAKQDCALAIEADNGYRPLGFFAIQKDMDGKETKLYLEATLYESSISRYQSSAWREMARIYTGQEFNMVTGTMVATLRKNEVTLSSPVHFDAALSLSVNFFPDLCKIIPAVGCKISPASAEILCQKYAEPTQSQEVPKSAKAVNLTHRKLNRKRQHYFETHDLYLLTNHASVGPDVSEEDAMKLVLQDERGWPRQEQKVREVFAVPRQVIEQPSKRTRLAEEEEEEEEEE